MEDIFFDMLEEYRKYIKSSKKNKLIERKIIMKRDIFLNLAKRSDDVFKEFKSEIKKIISFNGGN